MLSWFSCHAFFFFFFGTATLHFSLFFLLLFLYIFFFISEFFCFAILILIKSCNRQEKSVGMQVQFFFCCFCCPKCSVWNACVAFPLWNIVLGKEREVENKSITANQFTADSICYKLFLLCGRLTNSRWKRWRGNTLEALPMWQAISGLCVISVPYSRQLASHAWLLDAERRPTDCCSISSAVGDLPSRPKGLEEKVQRNRNYCAVVLISQGFTQSACCGAGPASWISWC